MKVSRTVTISIKDLNEIQKRIENGKEESFSKFVQRIVGKELNE
jgi:hypothetical protein